MVSRLLRGHWKLTGIGQLLMCRGGRGATGTQQKQQGCSCVISRLAVAWRQYLTGVIA